MEHMDGWCIDPTECKSSWAVAEFMHLTDRHTRIFNIPITQSF